MVKYYPLNALTWLRFVQFCVSLVKDSLNMDGTLPTDFAKSETMRDDKILFKGLFNNLKKDIDFQN